MGGPVTVMQPIGDEAAARAPGAADGRPAPSMGEVYRAAREYQAPLNTDWQNIVYDEEFAPVLAELNRRRRARGELALLPPSMARAPDNRLRRQVGTSAYGVSGRTVGREGAAAGILQEVARERQLDPNAFKGLETDLDKFMAPRWAKERQRRGAAGAVLQRSEGAGATAVSFLGSMTKGFEDPLNIATLPIGGGGRTFAMRLLGEFAANAGSEALTLPNARQNLGKLGEDLTARDALVSVASAGAGGVVFRGGLEGTAVAGKYVFNKAYDRLPLDWRLAQQLKREVPSHLRTPEQQAAIHVIERDTEIDASSPWRPTHQALDAHAERLQAHMEALQEGTPLPPPVTAKPAVGAASAAPGMFNRDDALRYIVRDLEGGPRLVTDSGGLTKYGISAKGNPGVDIANLSEAQAMAIYRKKYAEPLNMSDRPADVQFVALDASINHGPEFAARLLREGGNDPARMIALRRAEYARLIRENPAKYQQYEKGWENRLQKVEARLGLNAGEAGAMPAAVDPVDLSRPAALDAERPVAELPELEIDPGMLQPALVSAVRDMARLRGGRSLNDIDGIAAELEVDPFLLREAMDSLVATGELRRLGNGNYRRVAVQDGPEDMLRYLARRGGLSPDGFSAGQRSRNLNMDNPPRGHDLKNSGNLDKFVPGAGPLLRSGGLGLDEAGLLLHDAGYFGPVATTPRPTEAELITLLDDVIRRGEKRYSFSDQPAPDARVKPDGPAKAGFQTDNHYEHERGLWRQSAQRVLGRDLDEAEFAQLYRQSIDDPIDGRLLREIDGPEYDAGENLDPYVARMVNREIDAVLEDAYLELEDPLYDFDFDPDSSRSGEAGGAGQGGRGSAADPGNPGAGGEGAGTGAADGGAGRLDPAARDAAEAEGALGQPNVNQQAYQAFDDPAGEGLTRASESLWHDVRAQLAADPDALARPIDLDDGKGARTIADIEAELDADDAAIAAIRGCME